MRAEFQPILKEVQLALELYYDANNSTYPIQAAPIDRNSKRRRRDWSLA